MTDFAVYKTAKSVLFSPVHEKMALCHSFLCVRYCTECFATRKQENGPTHTFYIANTWKCISSHFHVFKYAAKKTKSQGVQAWKCISIDLPLVVCYYTHAKAFC